MQNPRHPRFRRTVGATVVLVACALGAGCATGLGGPGIKMDASADALAATMTTAERTAFERLYQEGERNAVLNFNELGVAALEAGHYDRAAAAFDEAIQRIERVYANDENARKAKSVWAEESVKDFKGEPYERAMAFYYRGLLYLHQGDYQNARAAFLSADFQDAVAEKEEYQSDFALMNYLAAWASSCDGDRDKAEEYRSSMVQKDGTLAELSAVKPVLFLLEAGNGPVKGAAGKHRELLTFADSGVKAPTPVDVTAGTESLQGWIKAGDVVFQAMTRGGRPVQAVLDGKAQWKDGTQQAGSAMTTAGATVAMTGAMSGNNDMAAAGGYAALIGIALDIASSAMQAGADTRQWRTLPRDIYVIERDQVADTPDAPRAGYVHEGGNGSVAMQWLGREGACRIAWGRARDEQKSAALARKLETARGKRDDSFRQEIVQKLAPREAQS